MMIVQNDTVIELWEDNKQVSEIGLEDIKQQDWDIADFIAFQELMGRKVKTRCE